MSSGRYEGAVGRIGRVVEGQSRVVDQRKSEREPEDGGAEEEDLQRSKWKWCHFQSLHGRSDFTSREGRKYKIRVPD